jgi:hypothetical protein
LWRSVLRPLIADNNIVVLPDFRHRRQSQGTMDIHLDICDDDAVFGADATM